MTVNVLIISHLNIGHEHVKAAKITFGKEQLPLPVHVVEVLPDSDPDQILQQLKELINQLDQQHGILILTDLFGATPSNMAQKIQNENVSIVTGLNLPMLLSVMNYAQSPLHKLVEIALKSGQAGIIECEEKIIEK